VKINLSTESMARAAAKRPWLTVGIWLGALVGAFALITILMGTALTNDNNMTNQPESKQADTILGDRLGKQSKIDEMLIVKSETLTVDDAQFKTQVESLFTSVTALGPEVVLGGTNYYQTGDKTLVSADRHSTLIPLYMPLDGDKHVQQIYQIIDKITQQARLRSLRPAALRLTQTRTD
jgi:RND superfamily putative drug exporter